MTIDPIKIIYILIITTTTILIPCSYAMTTLITAKNEMERPLRCYPEKVYKKSGYNCANINLKEIPQYMKNMEVYKSRYFFLFLLQNSILTFKTKKYFLTQLIKLRGQLMLVMKKKTNQFKVI